MARSGLSDITSYHTLHQGLPSFQQTSLSPQRSDRQPRENPPGRTILVSRSALGLCKPKCVLANAEPSASIITICLRCFRYHCLSHEHIRVRVIRVHLSHTLHPLYACTLPSLVHKHSKTVFAVKHT